MKKIKPLTDVQVSQVLSEAEYQVLHLLDPCCCVAGIVFDDAPAGMNTRWWEVSDAVTKTTTWPYIYGAEDAMMILWRAGLVGWR